MEVHHAGRNLADPNWDQYFSVALDCLVFGSPCDDSMDLLALFIRYAVACRTDRRRVPMDDSATGSPFFEEMETQIRQARGRLNLRAIGEKAREAWTARGLAVTWEMQVLNNLEIMCLDVDDWLREEEEEEEEEEEGQEVGARSPAPYKVLVEDLKALQKAFKGVSGVCGDPLFSDLEARKTDLNRLRMALRLKDMRLEAQRALRQDDDGNDDIEPLGFQSLPFHNREIEEEGGFVRLVGKKGHTSRGEVPCPIGTAAGKWKAGGAAVDHVEELAGSDIVGYIAQD
ncbi:hypothetical protein F4802DRAFT_602917 [Xylaria palmicola]|nr:hypothetical protein F4802DRAFT_602917 [Xylaria palmicola]